MFNLKSTNSSVLLKYAHHIQTTKFPVHEIKWFHSIHDWQGGHAVWKSGKTGKMAKTNSLKGKIREFQNLKKNQGIIGEFYKKWRKEMCLLVASLHEIYQINLFHQTNCKQYAFYCSLNNWVNIWCIWHSTPCSTKS